MILLFLLMIIHTHIQPSLPLNEQGHHLQTLKHSLSDPTGIFSDWNIEDPNPCNWTGVTCDPFTLSLVSLNISSAYLSGPFPASVCRLSSLSYLSFLDNSITSSLPPGISDCQNLTYLDLSQNTLKGPIPYTISRIPNLAYLDLNGNYFSGHIPASFGLFQRLQFLDLSGNLLGGNIPSVLGNVTTLTSLHLAWNPFSPGRIPAEFGNLTNLDDLWLTDCNLVGEIPASLAQLSRLTNFDVSQNKLDGPIPDVIFHFSNAYQILMYNNSFAGNIPAVGWSNLTALINFDASMNELAGTIPEELCKLKLGSLNLFSNQLEGAIPETISKSPNLYELKLFSNKLVGSLPAELGLYSPLTTFDVSKNPLSGEIPKNLCKNEVLEELIFIYTNFSGKIPATLGGCRSLTRVRMRHNKLHGEVPAGLWGLPHIDLLDLHDNMFSGEILNMISGALNLSKLLISKNQFSGSLPNEIGSLSRLMELSANDNNFSGEIPDSLMHIQQLVKLDLSNNQLSGKIPPGIQSMIQLNELDLGNNKLSGKIPEAIGDLQALNYLDLSRNFFSGEIPAGLQNLKLNKFNLSNNKLTGKIPPLFAKSSYKSSFIGNPGLCGDIPDICPIQERLNRRIFIWTLRLIYMTSALIVAIVAVCFFLKYKRFKKTKLESSLTNWRSFHKLGFSENEIVDSLNENNIIGSGGSGKVYKATLKNGEMVAIKRIWNKPQLDERGVECKKGEYETEVETLSRIRHKNIVRLWCCCNVGDYKLLVYEYMQNGSLGDVLHGKKINYLVDWPTRLQIALDTAEGIAYLHHDCIPSIVHRDVKSNNILLDTDFRARISDFGVAKVIQEVSNGPATMSAITGSCGYIAPEYAYTLQVNEKSDTYSFGVVILELVTGKPAVDQSFGEKDLAKWVCTTLDRQGVDRVVDPDFTGSNYMDQVLKVLDIGLHCINIMPTNRPTMKKVVKMLQDVNGMK